MAGGSASTAGALRGERSGEHGDATSEAPRRVVEAPTEGKQSPVRMARAKEWDETVENAYRLQEAGYRDLAEARSLGHPEPELWPQTGLIRKLTTKESMRKEVPSTLYFRKQRECADKDLSKVKLYYLAE
eukprot:CAMPEP_0181219016 /NCGR_PEP_ID=MMETSP1096-20121128/28019_1 /TAXON_ID=156174 ORGANISM="Chrysochromulina ericina, Strain CCMP281" /NCGR_SAMPLE_ID=MMETSP1096 /ASSEMBLY_ACC=CAM_ASM_000453 /LENGTH=129 /DNA_ID=CAMNT_0023311305 /DNA_START=81 /DNA_END=470 /DNA_ORIENTATION=-